MGLKMPHNPKTKSKPKKAPSQDLEVTVVMMGGRRCGKTSVLASMQKCFEEKFNGQSPLKISPADDSTLGAIEQKRHELAGHFNQKKPYFTPEATQTPDILNRGFTVGLRGKTARITISFVDFPGEWLGGRVEQDDLQELKDYVGKSRIVLVAIDTPYLLEQDGTYNELSNRCYRVTELLKECGFGDQESGLLLFVPIKCEKYWYKDENGEIRKDEIFTNVQKAYRDLIQYVGGSEQGGYLMVTAPIVTLGGASFGHFRIGDDGELILNSSGIPEEPIYKFSGSGKYEPENCDIPLLFVLAYTLAMAKRARDKKRMFGPIGMITDWFQESVLNWPAAKEYLEEYDSILKRLQEERVKGTFEVLNKSSWITL